MSSTPLLKRLTSPFALVALAVVLRFAFVLSMGNRFYFADTAEYEEAAIRLLAGQAPGATSPRAPLFPIEMAIGFLIGGKDNLLAVRMIQLVLAGVLTLLGIRLAARLGGRTAGVITGLCLAVGPTLVFTTGMLYPTLLYSTLLMAAISAAVAADDAPKARHGASIGAALSLAYLTDPVAIAPGLALFAWLAAGLRRRRSLLPVLAAAVLTTLVVLGPYVAWRKAAYGHKAVFMQKAQYVLHYSRTDSLLAEGRQVKLKPGAPYVPLATGAFVKQELRILREQPAAYLHDVTFEFLHFFKAMPDRIQTKNQYNRGPVLMLGAVWFVPVLVFSIVGLLWGASEARKRWALALLVLATAFLYSLFFTQTRYRIPVEPMMVILASLGVLRLFPAIARVFGDEAAHD